MTIVVVDDNPEARALTVRALAKAGYSVQSGGTAVAAIDLARSVRDIALVVLDIHMPGATGYEALEVIKSDPKLKDIPVLMLSGTVDVNVEREKAVRMGAVNLLGFPIKDVDLVAAVRQAIGRRRGAAEES
jgi:CheY-like chemotaxis protein